MTELRHLDIETTVQCYRKGQVESLEIKCLFFTLIRVWSHGAERFDNCEDTGSYECLYRLCFSCIPQHPVADSAPKNSQLDKGQCYLKFSKFSKNCFNFFQSIN